MCAEEYGYVVSSSYFTPGVEEEFTRIYFFLFFSFFSFETTGLVLLEIRYLSTAKCSTWPHIPTPPS